MVKYLPMRKSITCAILQRYNKKKMTLVQLYILYTKTAELLTGNMLTMLHFFVYAIFTNTMHCFNVIKQSMNPFLDTVILVLNGQE